MLYGRSTFRRRKDVNGVAKEHDTECERICFTLQKGIYGNGNGG